MRKLVSILLLLILLTGCEKSVPPGYFLPTISVGMGMSGQQYTPVAVPVTPPPATDYRQIGMSALETGSKVFAALPSFDPHKTLGCSRVDDRIVCTHADGEKTETMVPWKSREKQDWIYSFDDAKKIAVKLKRPIYIAFSKDNCGACESVKDQLYSKDNEATRRIEKECVGVWCYATPKNQWAWNLANEYGITDWPAAVIVWPDGSHRNMISPVGTDPSSLAGIISSYRGKEE